MCSETSEAVGTIWEHAQKEFQKFLKIRITLVLYEDYQTEIKKRNFVFVILFFTLVYGARTEQSIAAKVSIKRILAKRIQT